MNKYLDSNHMKIYRSLSCINNVSQYPLKKVEIRDIGDMYLVQIYDVGFEPPYWDTHRFPLMNIDPKNNGSFDEAVNYLNKEESITVNGWQIVEFPFYIVSNVAIRDEIRQNLTENENFKDFVDQFISIDTFKEAFSYFNNNGNDYGGHPVYARMIFQNYDQIFLPGFEPIINLRSYENFGSFIPADRNRRTRNAELIGLDRMIIKGTNDSISFGCNGSDTDQPNCFVYEQDSQSYLSKGQLIKVIFNFFNKNELFVIDKNGFNKILDDQIMPWKIMDKNGRLPENSTHKDKPIKQWWQFWK